MARNKSRSHRRRTNSRTDRLRCGNNCANMSKAVCETAGAAVAEEDPAEGDVGPDSMPPEDSPSIEMLLQSDGVGEECLGSVTDIP